MQQKLRKAWYEIVAPAKVGYVVAAFGFIFRMSAGSVSSVNSVVSCNHWDFGAMIVAAGVAAAFGYGMFDARKSRNPSLNYKILAVLPIFAIIHLLRSFYLIGTGPCADVL